MRPAGYREPLRARDRGERAMKKRRLTVRLRPPETRQREALAAWLREWDIGRTLEVSDAEGVPPPDRLVIPGTNRARRRPLRDGEVRLLRPGDGDARLRYFLVLDAPVAGPIRAVPFGRFSLPAVPGEWRTGHPSPALGVLCFWNALDLPRATAERAWPVADFGTGRLAAARRAARLPFAPDVAPPEEWIHDVGPSLRHPDDLRWGYLLEEAAAWERISAGDETAAEPPLVLRDRPARYGEETPASLPLAAEPKPGYGPQQRRKHKRKEM